MVCFGSKWKNKQLPIEKLSVLLQWLEKEYNPFFLFVYGNREEELKSKELGATFTKSQAVGGLESSPLASVNVGGRWGGCR